MAQKTITVKCDPLEAPVVKDLLRDNGFVFSEAPYAYWRAKSSDCNATFYTKGKLVIQGQQAELWADMIGVAADSAEGPTDPFNEGLKFHPTPAPQHWAGIDETGKGDYFGPLVVVAAAIERDRVDLLRELGVNDSKKLTDKKIGELAPQLKACCTFRTVTIGPARYNSLYAKIGNLNRLLAWAHARALEDLLTAAPTVTWALSDQFARDTSVVGRQLMEQGRKIVHAQRTKAENDPAVAVASIIARNEFVWQMKKLGRDIGRELPKGAGPPVLAAAREIVSMHGKEALGSVAKLHFRTTEQI